ncbi:unnamed protein product [Calicophoron daubneyi]|uniref:Glutathione peroxidase n=1 Tax=Calicophoron daubneyi TaxID=300641 RepID=A0AAV2T6P3_CALDB
MSPLPFRSFGVVRLAFAVAPRSMSTSSGDPGTVYQFSAQTIDGNSVSLSKYKGFVCLIVNVASKCGFTAKNYPQLQELHTRLYDQGLRILGFSCNQFGGQEPLSEPEIKQFVADKYGVTFDMFSKVDVNGSDTHPLFKFLKEKLHGTITDAVKWNFTKFLVDRKGIPRKRYSPQTDPLEIEKDILDLLKEQ